ncbi:TetR/AcrR family transcriptional regulator [Microbacterium sp. cx-55]|uniref:TetR/AcrR family transcriptional regulator n=1 Tax=unclassified Microbacterium TaxID=2609290 RepID=UPI001CC08E4E|nr:MULTISPECIES: TetR/AcrR family transcriptional regulator [unclassified Microbacterium]MBZ4488338.1 TetR/AcrR family transcriptional regulator [Microbacterium sp. cx-55]MCC4909397.1 TetR/AcrR family transcriptional regulator [Microbacterium sp. cx-59]UGB34993.1 TetR/AcrR family transcriptional regulator [Microbacterium sp. cx-55]
MPRLTDPVRQQRMTRIADAAQRCFAREGFAGTSMADIIAESGMSAGSIYSHFTGKTDLARFTATAMLEKRRTSLAELTASGGTPTPLQVLTRLYGDIAHPGVAPILVQLWAEAPHNPDLAELAHHKFTEIRRLLQGTLRPWADTQGPDAERLASDAADTIMLLFQGIVIRGSIDPDADSDALLRAVSRLLR